VKATATAIKVFNVLNINSPVVVYYFLIETK